MSLCFHYAKLENEVMQSGSVARNKSIALPKISKITAHKNSNIKACNNLRKDLKSLINNKKLKIWI